MNHNDKSISSRSYSLLLVMITCTFLTVSCSFQSTFKFPDISYINKSNVPTKVPVQTNSTEIKSGTLKIALPISDECLQYLSLMYIGESTGLFNETNNVNGLTVSLDTLNSFKSGIDVVLQTISSTGITLQDLDLAILSNSMPDIMLIKNNSKTIMNKINPAPIGNSLLDKYLSPSMIYPAMIQEGISDNNLYSVPYYASIKMLYANDEILVDASKNPLLPITSQIDFSTMSSFAKAITRTDTGVYGFMGLSELLAYYPMTLDPYVNSYMWNGDRFDFSNVSFSKSITAIKSLINSGVVQDSLSLNQQKIHYGDIDPKLLKKIGFWVDDSNQLDSWNSLGVTRIKRYPIQSDLQFAIPLSIYSIVINPSSKLLEEAKSFATYLALDKNALLFRSRYTNPNGFIPPLRDRFVWESLVKTQLQGEELLSLYDKMDFSKSVTIQDEQIVKEIFKTLYDKYLNDILYSRKSFATFTEIINTEANLAISLQ